MVGDDKGWLGMVGAGKNPRDGWGWQGMVRDGWGWQGIVGELFLMARDFRWLGMARDGYGWLGMARDG